MGRMSYLCEQAIVREDVPQSDQPRHCFARRRQLFLAPAMALIKGKEKYRKGCHGRPQANEIQENWLRRNNNLIMSVDCHPNETGKDS
jgi:hypothetical protein